MSTLSPPPRTGPLAHPLVERYLAFVEARTRPNTVLATASDLRIFFDVVGKEPTAVTTEDVLEFLQDQRKPFYDGKVVRLSDGVEGLDHQAPVVVCVRFLRLFGHDRQSRCQPGP
jgi:hypothetical protein